MSLHHFSVAHQPSLRSWRTMMAYANSLPRKGGGSDSRLLRLGCRALPASADEPIYHILYFAFGLLRSERCSGERQTVYSARREADLVMTSTGEVKFKWTVTAFYKRESQEKTLAAKTMRRLDQSHQQSGADRADRGNLATKSKRFITASMACEL